MFDRAAVEDEVELAGKSGLERLVQVLKDRRAFVVGKIRRLHVAEAQLAKHRLAEPVILQKLEPAHVEAGALQRLGIPARMGPLDLKPLPAEHHRPLRREALTGQGHETFEEDAVDPHQAQPPTAQRAQKPPSTSNFARKETITTQPIDRGRNTFQPSRMSWS